MFAINAELPENAAKGVGVDCPVATAEFSDVASQILKGGSAEPQALRQDGHRFADFAAVDIKCGEYIAGACFQRLKPLARRRRELNDLKFDVLKGFTDFNQLLGELGGNFYAFFKSFFENVNKRFHRPGRQVDGCGNATRDRTTGQRELHQATTGVLRRNRQTVMRLNLRTGCRLAAHPSCGHGILGRQNLTGRCVRTFAHLVELPFGLGDLECQRFGFFATLEDVPFGRRLGGSRSGGRLARVGQFCLRGSNRLVVFAALGVEVVEILLRLRLAHRRVRFCLLRDVVFAERGLLVNQSFGRHAPGGRHRPRRALDFKVACC